MPGEVRFKVRGTREIEAALKELGAAAANRRARELVFVDLIGD